MEIETISVTCQAERLAVKSICASDILHNVISLAKELDLLNKKLTRYVYQIQLLLTWRRGTAALKMAGSATKTVASVMVLAAPLHPKLQTALSIGHKLWRLGTGLKILNVLANIVRDVWRNGCRKCLIEFSSTAASLTKNLGVFGEVIRDLQLGSQSMNTESKLETPRQLFNMIKPFIPSSQHLYVAHVTSMVFGGERYSSLFDFISLVSNPANKSSSMQLMRELESLNFTEFAEETDSKCLLALSALLHVSREILDFLDGFHQFSDKDCTFLHECLVKFTQESASIVKVVLCLVNLCTDRTKTTSLAQNTSILDTPHQISKESKTVDMNDVAENTLVPENLVQVVSSDSTAMDVDLNSCLSTDTSIKETPFDEKTEIWSVEDCRTPMEEPGQDKTKMSAVLQTFSFSSLSDLMERGSSALFSIQSRKGKETSFQSQFQGGDALNRI